MELPVAQALQEAHGAVQGLRGAAAVVLQHPDVLPDHRRGGQLQQELKVGDLAGRRGGQGVGEPGVRVGEMMMSRARGRGSIW